MSLRATAVRRWLAQFEAEQRGQSGAGNRLVNNGVAAGRHQRADDANSQLKAKLLKLIYLINKLPADAALDIGLKATEEALADLLVTDLSAGSAELRKQLPDLLSELQNNDLVPYTHLTLQTISSVYISARALS